MSSRHSSSVGPTGITGWLFGGSQKIVANHIADGSEGDDGPQMDVEVHQRPQGSVSSYDMGGAPPSASLLSSFSVERDEGTLFSSHAGNIDIDSEFSVRSDEDRFLRGGLDTSSFIHTADRSRGSWQNGGYDDGYGHEGRLFGGSFHEENGTAHNLPPLNSQPPTSWNATESTTGHTFLQQVSEAGLGIETGNFGRPLLDAGELNSDEISSERPEEAQFGSVLQQTTDLFEALRHFKEICHSRATTLGTLSAEEGFGVVVGGSVGAVRAQQERLMLTMERNTWALLLALYRDRHYRVQRTQEGNRADTPARLITISQKQIKKEMLQNDHLFRESKIVTKWLEEVAAWDSPKCYHVNATLRNTLHLLISNGAISYDVVNSLDPDAPLRQKKSIHPEDAEDERRMLGVLWLMLRSGKRKGAAEFSRQCGQPWRASTLNVTLSKLPIIPMDEGEGMDSDPYHVWKAACHKLSDEPALADYERAVYGALCGNLTAMVGVCHSWEDHLWARYKALTSHILDKELNRQYSRLGVNGTNGVSPHENTTLTSDFLHRIFDDLIKSDVPALRHGVNEPHHIIQTLLILGKKNELMNSLAEWTLFQGKRLSWQGVALLRCAVHIGLFFQSLYEDCPRINELLTAYIQYLIETNQRELVALYTSRLPVKDQVETYAQFLRSIEARHERERCLDLADKAGLDINRITRQVVELVRVTSPHEEKDTEMEEELGKLQREVSQEDASRISVIEWLLFDPAQRAEALIQANALARKFILANKHLSLQRLLQVLPRDSVAVIQRAWRYKESAEEKNAVREFICYKQYCAAFLAYQEWARVMYERPVEPRAGSTSLPSQQIVYSNQLKAYKQAMTAWQASHWEHAQRAMKQLYTLLLFPSGWLVDSLPSLPQSQYEPHTYTAETLERVRERAEEMERIRERVVVEAFFMCHAVLHGSGQYGDAVELADLVADEYHHFYALFTRDQLRRFLSAVHKSALAILQDHPEPLPPSHGEY